MNELYCKKCGEYVGKSGDPSKLPTECPNCGMRFFTQRIGKMPLYGLFAGGAQIANGQIVKGSIFGSLAFTGMLFGSLMFTPIGGIIISGLIVAAGMGEGIKTAENMGGFSDKQIARVD